ncbi:hypothetical protein Ocin01_04493 [Orchesella cincta]|uniref:Uncharacterized protein n=1 Tax=Orchesella cincta TaxID=48709 RepID=A0A1D2NAB8_ORCCI|nr:hypothetical protein Ocin01_04493 [Orchesella cincta]
MLNIKRKYSKKGLSREQLDDLSIVTGLQPTRRKQAKFEKWKMVRHENARLKQQFIHARAQALIMKNLTTADSTSGGGEVDSPYFRRPLTPNENQPPPSLFNQQQQAESPIGRRQTPVTAYETTINSVPRLVRTSLPRGPMPRSVLKPISQNTFPKRKSEAEFWSSYCGPGRKPAKSVKCSTVHNMSTQSSSGYGTKSNSMWFRSGYPMTRQDASIVQQEVASMASSSSSGSSVTSPNFFPTNNGQQQGYNGGNFPGPGGAPVRSLINRVQPPSVNNQNGEQPLWTPQRIEYGCVMQGRWVSRDQLGDPAITRKYSIAQLMDILLGDSVPSDSDLTRTMFQPGQVMSSTIYSSENTLQMPPMPTLAAQDFPNSAPNTVCSQLFDNNEQIRTTSNITNSEQCSEYFSNQQPRPVQTTATTSKKKSVSFLTDDNNNICVERIMYDLFSQDAPGLDSLLSSNELQTEFPDLNELFPPHCNNDVTAVNPTGPVISPVVPDSQRPLFDFRNNFSTIPRNGAVGGASEASGATIQNVNFEFGMGANISVDAQGIQKTFTQEARDDVFNFENLTTTYDTLNNTLLTTENNHSSHPIFHDVLASAQSQEEDGYTTSEFFLA